VALGVALAYSVHLINSSALAEFGAGVRAANGEPDLTRARPRLLTTACSTAWPPTPRAAGQPGAEVDTYARHAVDGRRVAVRVLGVDALQVAVPLAPELLPSRPSRRGPAGRLLDPEAVFANPRRARTLGCATATAWRCRPARPSPRCAWPAAWPPAARRCW
jgi:putative ABC transport system permease protein